LLVRTFPGNRGPDGVVTTTDRYEIVRKQGEAGALADKLDGGTPPDAPITV